MKHTFVGMVLALVLLAGCGHTGSEKSDGQARGWIDRTTLNGYSGFQVGYDTVQVRTPFVAMLKNLADSVQTIVFLGTWCPDSRREVPRFLKVADQAGIPPSAIKLYALDRTKKSDDGLSERYGIERIPTFIFLKAGKEIGRIVEVPQATVEEDMLTILAKASAGQ